MARATPVILSARALVIGMVIIAIILVKYCGMVSMYKCCQSAMFSSAPAFTLKIGGHIFATGEWRPRLVHSK